MTIEQIHERNQLSEQYPPEETAQLCRDLDTDRERKIYIDTLKQLDGLSNDEVDKFKLTPIQLGVFRFAVIPKDRDDVIWAIENSLYKIPQCLCPGYHIKFENTEDDRMSSFASQRAVLEQTQYPEKPDLIQLHICCKSCRGRHFVR